MNYVGIAGAILCRVGWAKQSDNPGKFDSHCRLSVFS